MKWEEFLILNMVITSMLSRLWVIFRGVLVNLSTLYQQLLAFLSEVAQSRPMPFLTDFSLPADMAQFLGPSAFLRAKQPKYDSLNKEHRAKQQRMKKSSGKLENQRKALKVKEDLGVAIDRDIAIDADMKPFLKIFRNFTEETHKADPKQKFRKQVRDANTFTDMTTCLDEMIIWCKSKRMKKEKRLLTFLRLKCQKFKSLEAEGYNVQRKLQTFRQEACWASSPRGSVPRTCRSSAALRRKAHVTTRFQSLRARFKSAAVRNGAKKKGLKRCQKSELSVSGLSEDGQKSRTTFEQTPLTTDCESHDDIDDIFASAGL